MTTKKELLQKIVELQAQVNQKELLQKIAELQAQVDAMPDEFRIETVRAYENLSNMSKYSFIDSMCEPRLSIWYNDDADKSRLNNGQVFLTEEAAQREAKRHELWHSCRKAMKDAWEAFGEMPDWANDMQAKHCIFMVGNIIQYTSAFEVYERIYFPTRDSFNAWQSTVTDDDIKLMLIEEW